MRAQLQEAQTARGSVKCSKELGQLNKLFTILSTQGSSSTYFWGESLLATDSVLLEYL